MSMWTHITASLYVDTYIESNTIKEDVEKMLEKAPKITGSEGPADIFVNVPSGYNISIYEDDVHTEFQTRVIITINGDLRDRTKDQTEKEWNKFKAFIGEDLNDESFIKDPKGLDFGIENYSCKIWG